MKDLSLHILDIVQNSLVAGATEVIISFEQDLAKNLLSFTIEDNGCGMSPETLNMVTDPYFTTRTTRKVGLGIPLLKQNAELAGGFFHLESTQGIGTRLVAQFGLDHFDRPPIGDLLGVIILLIGANPSVRFKYTHAVDGNKYVLDTKEVNEALEGSPINDALVMKFLKEMLRENLSLINAI